MPALFYPGERGFFWRPDPMFLNEMASPWWWLDPLPGSPSPFYGAVGLAFLIGFGACLYLRFVHAPKHWREHPVKMKVGKVVSVRGLILFGMGSALAGFRYAQVPYFSMRVLFFFALLALLASLVYLAYFLAWPYRADLAAYENIATRRRSSSKPKDIPLEESAGDGPPSG